MKTGSVSLLKTERELMSYRREEDWPV